MRDNLIKEYFERIDRECTRCGNCSCKYKYIGYPDFKYGDLANMILSELYIGGDLEDVWKWFFKSCDMCGFCVIECPINLNTKSFTSYARALLMDKHHEKSTDYRNVRVDHKYNLFSVLRDIQGVDYDDALGTGKKEVKSLYFTSCHLGSKFPALTKASYEKLKDLNIVDGITAHCCGNTLYAAGLKDEFIVYAEKFSNELKSAGVERIITPCPNCYDFFIRLKELGYLDDNVNIDAYAEVMVENGISISPEMLKDKSFTIHDSCQDRFRGDFSGSVRELLKDAEIREMALNRKNTHCCGSGGLSPYGDVDVSKKVRASKVNLCEKTGATDVVTTCYNCYDSINSAISGMEVTGILELLTGETADWKSYREAMTTMKSEEYNYSDKMKNTEEMFDEIR